MCSSDLDRDYRGEVGVVLFNHGDQDFEVKMGDRIAQLILEKIDTLPVEEVQGLDSTVRGTGGFGSTGMQSRNDAGNFEKKKKNDTNERAEENKNKEATNETLTIQIDEKRVKTEGNKKKTEGSSRLSRERQIISAKQLRRLIKKKTPVFLTVVRGHDRR